MEDQRVGTILWRGRFLILLSLVATVAVAIAGTALTSKVYEATGILQIRSPNPQPGSNTDAINQGLAKNYATVIVSRSFLQRIRPQIEGGRLSTGELQSRLNAKAVEMTALVELRAQGSSPDEAQRLAASAARGFLSVLRGDATAQATQQQGDVQTIIVQLSNKIDALSRGPQTAGTAQQIDSLRTARDALTKQSASLIANGVAQGASATLVASPTASSAPVKPQPVLNVAAGILIGLLLGVGLAWLRERLSPRLHTAEDATAVLDLPVLASIPLRRRMPGDPVLNEAYEVLRANLVFRSRDQALRVVTFVSQNPAVGKTSSVEGLAYAAVRGGASVLVIDGDLRAGTLSERFGHADSPGLTNVVVGSEDPEDAIVPLAPGLSLLPANGPAPNPPSLLYSSRMRSVITELRGSYDLIVIDSPPIAHLADGLILASLSDGVALVARTGVTTKPDLAAAAASLRQSATQIIGLVMFEPRTIDSKYYPASVQTPPMVHDSA